MLTSLLPARKLHRSISVSFGSIYFLYSKALDVTASSENLFASLVFSIISLAIWVFKGQNVMFFLIFFLFNPPPLPSPIPPRLECSRIRKAASFLLMSHRLKKYKNLHPHRASQTKQKCDINVEKKLLIFEAKLRDFFRVSYLSEMKTVSMFYNSSFLS